jgi:hypothetical protein
MDDYNWVTGSERGVGRGKQRCNTANGGMCLSLSLWLTVYVCVCVCGCRSTRAAW